MGDALTMGMDSAVSALATSSFSRVVGAAGAAGWIVEVTPPLPLGWPGGRLAYYAYARRHPRGLVDAHQIAGPWARIDAGQPLVLTALATELKPLGTESVRPATRGEVALFQEVDRAGPLERQLAAAARDPAAALLVRRHYCHWQKANRIAREVLPLHPEFAAFLDCASVVAAIEPVRPVHPSTLTDPEFYRRWPQRKDGIWLAGLTDAFPEQWPATATTRLCYYAFAMRVNRSQPVPSPREVTEPFGLVVRQGQGGPIAFTTLCEMPASLGIQPGRAPAREWYALLRAMGDDRDAMLVHAASDAEAAATVRGFYREWVASEALVAARVLPRHPAFAAFLQG